MSRCLALRAEQKPRSVTGSFLERPHFGMRRDPRLVIAPCILKRGPAFEKWTHVARQGLRKGYEQ